MKKRIAWLLLLLTMALPLAGCGKGSDAKRSETPVVSEVIWLDGEPVDNRYNKRDFSEAEWIVVEMSDGTYQIYDYAGNRVTEKRFDSINSFSEGLAAVKKDGKMGLC